MTLTTRDKISYFDDRCIALRKEITEAIIDLLEENNLTELNLTQMEGHQIYVVWFNEDCNGYDSRVNTVRLIDGTFELELDGGESNESTHTVSHQNGDFALNNTDWLIAILESMRFTLSLPESKGVDSICTNNVSWSYDNPGITELPESEEKHIRTQIIEGYTEGELCYYDENEVEYRGWWRKVKSN